MARAWSNRSDCSGSALIYILIAIALLAAITATFMDSSGQNQSSQSAFALQSKLNSEFNMIRSAIQECVITYPEGDKTMPAPPAPVFGMNLNRPYPVAPNSGYLVNPSAGNSAEYLRCPGNPGNSNNHAPLFGSNLGKFFPKQESFLSSWYYYNNTDGIYLAVWTGRTDEYIKTAFQKLNEQYAPCEADYLNATVVTPWRSDGSTLGPDRWGIRFWLVVNPTAVFVNEPGCPLP